MHTIKDDLFYLGIIKRTKGLKGHLFCLAEIDDISMLQNIKHFFLSNKNKNLIPYRIESIQLSNKKHFTVKFEGVSDIENAKNLNGSELYLPIELLPKNTSNLPYHHEIIGFEVRDKHKGVLGELIDVIDKTAQAILFVLTEDKKEIYIPFVEDFIIEINVKEKTILLNTPEGLIDIYLEEEDLS
jgi:16S rRNA processing protein RimM